MRVAAVMSDLMFYSRPGGQRPSETAAIVPLQRPPDDHTVGA